MKMSPWKYLLITAATYLLVGFFNLFVYRFTETEIIQVIWVGFLCLPLTIKPIANWVGTTVIWEQWTKND